MSARSSSPEGWRTDVLVGGTAVVPLLDGSSGGEGGGGEGSDDGSEGDHGELLVV